MLKSDQYKRRTPPNLIYGVDDKPPLWSLAILGIEHGALLISSLLATIFFAQELGASTAQVMSLVNIGLIAGGVTSILQATKKWGIGSGFFCLHTSSFIYFQASLQAAQTGGLSLVFGMTAAAGVIQTLLSRIIGRLRTLFPPEVAGLVVAMVGFALAPYAVRSLFGLGREDLCIELREAFVGVGTLAVIIGFNVWGGKGFKLYSILVGIVFGYGAAYITGVLPWTIFEQLKQLPFFAWPGIEHAGLTFDARLIIPFLIAAVCSSLKLTGDIITCQKINDLEWKRVDMASVKRGIGAEGIGTMLAGLFGGTGLAASSSNIGMSFASGATSRHIGYATGLFFIALSFFPLPTFILSRMPTPVVGAIIVYAACFMIVTGWSIIMTRMIDARKTFVIGISLIMGLSVLIIPELYASLPAGVKPIFGSSIALTAVTAVLLNLVFRIGIASRMELVLDSPVRSVHKIYDFFTDLGGKWGARPEVIRKAAAAASELHESLTSLGLARDEVRLNVSFDEFQLAVCAEYEGKMLSLSNNCPQPGDLLEDDQALSRLSGFLITQYADNVAVESIQGKIRVKMVFEH